MPDKRNFCVHAHFYQPTREDPFTGNIPYEPGAAPYANWNERILETCYRPNAQERNFSALSFNIGPTLAKWIAMQAPDVLEKIVQEDRLNTTLYGVGNALAQPYHHTILPLSNTEDKRTQIIWGIEAFKNDFGRNPQGMWLPETAVDHDTLRILAENDIRFTILAPWQVDVIEGESPYYVDLGNGNKITVFTYNGGLSSTVSFDSFATGNADAFAEFYLKPEINTFNKQQFLLIASDGELYGHHQPYRDKYLARLLGDSSSSVGLRPTFPGLWLKNNPVTGKARIIENTSWSCHHGVERWRADCSCTPGSSWKAGLREGLDTIAAQIDQAYVEIANSHGLEPFTARNEYIQYALGKVDFDNWLTLVSGRKFSSIGRKKLAMVMEAQWLRQQMFMSCGWFFDDLARIEPRNNLAYAAHAVVIMENITGNDFHTPPLSAFRGSVSRNGVETAADHFMFAYQRTRLSHKST